MPYYQRNLSSLCFKSNKQPNQKYNLKLFVPLLGKLKEEFEFDPVAVSELLEALYSYQESVSYFEKKKKNSLIYKQLRHTSFHAPLSLMKVTIFWSFIVVR